MRSRLGPLFIVLGTCLVGVLVLHLAGVALAPSIAIGILTAAAILFINWANTLHRRSRDSSRQ